MRTAHLFAGAGGGLLADLILGHTPILAVEWDKYCCCVLRERAADGWFPDLSVWEGDVRMFDPSEYTGKVDCIHAGFPCQDISVAGKQSGLGEGTRSGLYREVIRIAGVIRPQYIFLENVAAILNNGLECVLADLVTLGYEFRWTCLRASECGAPHHRDRWWLLAHSNSNGKPTVSLDAETVCESDSTRTERFNIWDVAYTSVQGLQKRKMFGRLSGQKEQSNKRENPSVGSWWTTEPELGRVVDGLALRTHRIKALGNGQVPIQAAAAWRILGGP